MNKKWTQAELDYILKNPTKTDKQLYEDLKKQGYQHSFAAVRKQRQRLDIGKTGGRPKKNPNFPNGTVVIKWTEDEEKKEQLYDKPGIYTFTPVEGELYVVESWGAGPNSASCSNNGGGGSGIS